jgi:hypothetical protein
MRDYDLSSILGKDYWKKTCILYTYKPDWVYSSDKVFDSISSPVIDKVMFPYRVREDIRKNEIF